MSLENDMSKQWLEAIGELWDSIGKPVDEKRMTVYARQLSILPLGLLERGITRAIRENGKYQTIPTISAVWEAVKKELENPMDLDAAIEQWIDRQFEKCIVRFQ